MATCRLVLFQLLASPVEALPPKVLPATVASPVRAVWVFLLVSETLLLLVTEVLLLKLPEMTLLDLGPVSLMLALPPPMLPLQVGAGVLLATLTHASVLLSLFVSPVLA